LSPWWKSPTEEGESESQAAKAEAAPEEQPEEQPESAPEKTEPKPEPEEPAALTAATILDIDESNESLDLDNLPPGLAPLKSAVASEEDKPRVRRRTTRRSTKKTDDEDSSSGTAKKTTAKKAAKKTVKKTTVKRSTTRKSAAAAADGEEKPAARSRARTRTREPKVEPATAAPTLDASGASALTLLTEALREAISTTPDTESVSHERRIALFCDLENVALGVRDSDEVQKFDIDRVLERLLEKGKIIVKKAYADWQRYSDFKRPLHTAGIELIDIPQKYYSGKNSADIKMVVDALELSFTNEHLDTFVILSGDSDFTPLVSKLKENNKHVICVGVKSSSSKLLIDNCDEFIYYEDLARDAQAAPRLEGLDEKTAECFALMNDAIQALQRDNKTVLWGSMIKQTMQRKRPSFNEGYFGYSSFSELLEDAERKKVISLKKDTRSGSYIVTGFGAQSK
jgi:uncharacterized protein (TIGR00288 family)